MKMNKVVGTGLLSVGLVVGLAGFAGATSGSIGTTGPDSNNEIKHESTSRVEVKNHNKLHLMNQNEQEASSGEAKTHGNTTGGDAESGSAANMNALDATVEVDNSGSAAGLVGNGMGSGGSNNSATISNTGPDSNNEVKIETKSYVDVSNKNDVHVSNTNEQSAYSGDAKVTHNTTGGSATTGAVSNSNSSSFTVRLTN